MTGDYFDELTVARQRLLWTIATRRQLERWGRLVAAHVLALEGGGKGDGQTIWQAQIEHHFALVAARNLLLALDLEPQARVSVDPIMRAELKEGRDLLEHWPENLPVFNISPRRVDPPRRSGRDFAERNPRRGPYSWLGLGIKTGAELLPNVSAPALHQLLDGVEAEVLGQRPELHRFVPDRAPSPWLHVDGEWWPKT